MALLTFEETMPAIRLRTETSTTLVTLYFWPNSIPNTGAVNPLLRQFFS